MCECLSGRSCSTLIKEAQGADRELESLTYLLLSDLVMQIEYSLVLRRFTLIRNGLRTQGADGVLESTMSV